MNLYEKRVLRAEDRFVGQWAVVLNGRLFLGWETCENARESETEALLDAEVEINVHAESYGVGLN